MQVNTRELADILVVELQGEIMGGIDSEKFKNLIYQTIENDVVQLVIDLSRATWMNSSGLGMLISGLTTIRSSGGDLRLANMSERVRRPLEITKLENVFLSYASVEEAVESYQPH
ncbi:MAG TPA: anti-sigma factor antagonist [bacterium]|nr:anti-sigma factor antagonist [bacterium]